MKIISRKRKITKLILLISLLQLFLIPTASYASRLKVTEEGFLVGYGYGRVGDCHNLYRPLLFIYHIGLNAHRLFPSVIPDTHKRLTFYLEPQYNKVIHPGGNYEFGLGFGFEYKFKLLKGFSDAYFLVGTGLHYISFDSKCQSGGFNFNDNLGTGLYIYVSQNSAINLGIRFRHISNANIRMPNKGINSILFMIGYSIFF